MPTVWTKRKILFWYALGFVFWVLVHKKTYNVKHVAVIKNSKPIDIWEYVADFNNMKKLNPTITNFTIEGESGNYEDWKYTVHYTEFLSNLPFIENYAVAHYQVLYKLPDSYIIKSVHTTCFYTSFICVNSESSFTFESKGDSTQCTEDVSYQCPPILSIFCEKEVQFQRQTIVDNLQNIFSTVG